MSKPRIPIARVIVTMTIALVVSGLSIVAGIWQYGRHEARAQARDDCAVAVEMAPVDVQQLVPPGNTELPDGVQWRTVTAAGTIDPQDTAILRARPVESTAAWQTLAWLRLDDGRAFLVDVGWQPEPGPDGDPQVAQFDSDERVTVEAVMRDWEEDDGKKQSGAFVTRISPAQLPSPPGEAIPGYGMVTHYCDGEGCRDSAVGEPVPLPELSLGPHLSYAWQWWLFAVLAPVGGVLLLRRDMAEDSPAGPPHQEQRPSRTRTRRPKELSDEEIEDAL